MRIVFSILVFTLLLSCTKEDSFVVPLHSNSYSWMIGKETKYYVNTKGDSVTTDSIISGHALAVKSENGIEKSYGTYFEIVYIDSLIAFTSYLEANLEDNIRKDIFWMKANAYQYPLDVETYGTAASLNSLDSSYANFHDSLVLNNVIYKNLYSTNTNSEFAFFISASSSVVGFALKQDTFNLVN